MKKDNNSVLEGKPQNKGGSISEPLIMLEFFAGSSVLSEEFRKAGHKVLTIDNNPKLNPDLCLDVLNFKIQDLPEEFRNPDVIFLGVPCTKFSVAGRSNNFTNHMPNNIDSCIALALVYKSLEIIKDLNPKSWFIENPMGYLRTFPFMQKLIRKELWYCQYGDNRAKPTDFWTNRGDWITKKCFNGNRACHHDEAPRGSKTGTQGLSNAYERGIYPVELCKDIVNLCQGTLKIIQLQLKGEN